MTPGRAAGAVLRLEGVAKSLGGHAVLREVSGAFHAGEMTVILGGRGSGKTTLAGLIAGQRVPDRGTVWRGGVAAPPAGAAWGFGGTVSVERDLALRAAAYGLDSADYIAEVAALLPRRDVLHQPFERLTGAARLMVIYGSCYLIPSAILVVDGTPIPNTHGMWGGLEALFQAARRRAAVVWISAGVTYLRRFEPERHATLRDGLLVHHPDLRAALAAFAEDDTRVAGV